MKLHWKYIILIIIGLLFGACTSDKSDYKKLISEWQGKEVIFPEILTDILTNDTLDIENANFSILTYIDSLGCTSCKMKLPLWNEFMLGIDTITDIDINLITIVNTDDKKELVNIIKCDEFHYPVIYDSTDNFNHLNSFPKNEALRTFLLDKSHKIIAIGNPVNNTAILHLYRDIISGRRHFDSDGMQYLQIDNPCVFVGGLLPGDTIKHTFFIHNCSEKTLFVEKTIPSCHCTSISLNSLKINPDNDLAVTLSSVADSTVGVFEKNILLYFKNIDIPVTLSIQGSVQI